MANNTQDFTKVFSDMAAAFPVDMSAYNEAVKNSAALGEKMSKVALDAAATSAELSSKWTKETLTKMSGVTKAQAEPTDYAKAATDFASATAESSAEHMAAFAEVAKKVQMETVELLMAAGKDIQEDTTAAVKKATDELTATAKKATKAA
ncbi:MAG: phasin, PhaP [Litoreibacter sp.]|uniref:phasin, PhaP n=1 Tax=Litoreibacter sp. TaxID=1969459 RepID=UPI0032989699